MFPLTYFKQFTTNDEYQTFCINQSQKIIKINNIEVDQEVLKMCGIRKENLNEFFKKLNSIKSERKTIELGFHTIEVIISKTVFKELYVKVDYANINYGYNSYSIEHLEETLIKTWNELFEDCLKVSCENDAKLFNPIRELYYSKTVKRYASLMDFHNFTMDILKADESTPLESAYKYIIKKCFEQERLNDDGFMLFDRIITECPESYLRICYYENLNGPNARYPEYKTHTIKIGRYHMPSYECDTIPKLADFIIKTLPTVKEIKDILFEEK